MVGLCAPGAALGQQSEAEIAAILADMVVQQHQFQPEALHALGLGGLSAVLDEVLPDTADPKKAEAPSAAVAQLLQQLGGSSYRERETASEKLYQMGPGIRPAVVEATRSADAEIGWRARRLLSKWDSRQWEDKGRYVPAFMMYVQGIKDEPRLRELLRRTLLAIDHGMPDGGRYQLLSQCITAIVRSEREELAAPLKPLLKHNDTQIAVLLTQAAGSAASGNCCPAILLEALRSDREEVLSMAINFAQNCAEGPHKEAVQQRLVAIFEGRNDHLKLQVCFPLMHQFHYDKALDFLLQQAQSTDRNQAYQALSALMNHRDQNAVPDAKVFKVLLPLLKSADNDTRRMAAMALGTYGGEEVVKNLVPLLADKYDIIADEVGRRLLDKPDKKLTRKLLTAAAKDDANVKVKKAAADLLQQIEQPGEEK